MRTLLKNARILKMNGEDIFSGDLLVNDNRIEYVGKSTGFAGKIDKTIDCNGNLLMPSFKNCHTHSAMVFLRSVADDLPLNDWLFNYTFPAEERLTPEDVYHLSKLAILEYLESGISACFDQYFYMNQFDKASREMGFRSVISLVPSGINRDYEGYDKAAEIYQYSLLEKDPLTTYCAALHAEYTSSEEEVDFIRRFILEQKAPFSTHISETKSEVQGCYERHGKSPVQFFANLDIFKYGGVLFHANHLSEEDVQIIKSHNLSVVTNPGSNSKLASGVCDVKKLMDNGINVCLGTDGAASNNSLDMFKEMALVSALQKLKYEDPSTLNAYDVLKMATVNGSKALGYHDIDTLEEGKIADIIMIDLNNPSMRPVTNIQKNIVYAGHKGIVKMTMVNGDILYYDHHFKDSFDVAGIIEKAQEISDRITEIFK